MGLARHQQKTCDDLSETMGVGYQEANRRTYDLPEMYQGEAQWRQLITQ
jgi:hypothetical protein